MSYEEFLNHANYILVNIDHCKVKDESRGIIL